ncbi:acyl-CoA thioesterase [Alicyclobacillus sp. SO9]|nr:acyl-CoA thioesterase [Alicyclobacillus sp. SO9]
MTIQVRSTEIDVNGHVNNAKYLEYLEWGREEWFEQNRLDYDVLKREGIVTVVVHISANYHREAVQNDRLTIKSRLVSVGNTSLTMEQLIVNQRGDKVLDASLVIVTTNPDTHRKTRVPDVIRKCIHGAG